MLTEGAVDSPVPRTVVSAHKVMGELFAMCPEPRALMRPDQKVMKSFSC